MESKNFKHFLITRFNVPVDEWKTTKNGEDVQAAEWLNHRFKLFEDYCLPSVANQKNKQFTWFVLFGADTPEPYKVRVSQFSATCPNFVPLYIGAYADILPTLKSEIDKRLDVHHNCVLTSRLDNDDALHMNYIDAIQNSLDAGDNFLIDATRGYSLVIEPFTRLTRLTATMNPFLSLLEQRNGYSTVLSRRHDRWHGTPIKAIASQPLWLQVIHLKNMRNDYRPGIGRSLSILQKQFGITKPVQTGFNPKYLWVVVKLQCIGILKECYRTARQFMKGGKRY